MSHGCDACQCPLASKHCEFSTLRRQQWFAAIRSQDAASMEKVAMLVGSGNVTREVFAAIDDKEGQSALHVAARENLVTGTKNLIAMLEGKMFRHNILDLQEACTKVTPLIEACKNGNLEIVKALCIAGAKWYLPDAKGIQPRQHAELAHNADILDFFNQQAQTDEEDVFQLPPENLQATPVAQVPDPVPVDTPDVDAPDSATAEEDGEEGKKGGTEEGEPPSAGIGREAQVADEAGIDVEAANHSEEFQSAETAEPDEMPFEFLSPHQAEEVMRVLCNLSFFSSLDAPSLKQLSRMCSQITLCPGQSLEQEEEEAMKAMYIIVSGKVIVEVEQLERIPPHPARQWSIRHRLKKRSYRRRLLENDCFGESVLLVGDKLRFRMDAEEETHLLELNKRAFNFFIQHHRRATPNLGSFLAGQLIDASHQVDDSQSADLAYEMQMRIAAFYNLPDEVEVVEDCKRSTVRKIIEIPLAEPRAKDGLNLSHCVVNTHGNSWLKSKGHSSAEKEGLQRQQSDKSRTLSKDDGTGYLSYLRVCEELSIRPRNSLLISLRNFHLRLDNMSLTTKEGRALGAALAANKHISSLDLSGNRFFNEAFVSIDEQEGGVGRGSLKYMSKGMGVLDAVLRTESQIEQVNLQQTQLGKCAVSGSKHIARKAVEILGNIAEINASASLTSLKLGSNFLACAGAVAIAGALECTFSTCKLTYLDVSNNGIANTGAKALGKMLASNTSLLELDLGWNHICEHGSVAVFMGMCDNEALTTLHFGWNRVGEQGGIALGKMLDQNKTISRIDLPNCGILNSACAPIAAGLKENTALTCIKLQWNPLGEGCMLILDALVTSPAKPLFSLENCSFNAIADGNKSAVDPRNVTQNYKFDLSREREREALQPLLELALKECGQCWRNERINSKRFHFPEEGIWVVPDAGILEFDFVDFESDYEEQNEMGNDDFRSFLQQVGRIMSSDGRLEIIKQACFSYCFSAEQVINTVSSLPREKEKEEAIVSFFSKMRQRVQFMPMVLLRCTKRADIVNLQRRLGPAKMFDEYRPGGPYSLDISKSEDRAVLKKLRKLKTEGKFNGCDCKFGFGPGLLRGFKGEILDSVVNVESLDLEEMAAESRGWAKEDVPPIFDDAVGKVVPRTTSADGEEGGQETLPPSPRRHTLSFDFLVLEMQRADMNAVFKGLMGKGPNNNAKLPPIAKAPEPADDQQQTEMTQVTRVKKKKSPTKKINRQASEKEIDFEEEDLDRKSIFPIPRTGADVQDIQQTIDFTAFQKERRSTGNDKAHGMIDRTSVRTKHVTPDGRKLRGGAKKWCPWAMFTRSHKSDYEVQSIQISSGTGAGTNSRQ